MTQVVAQLDAQGALDQRLLERHGGRVDGIARHGPADELGDQLIGNLRQGCAACGNLRVLLLRFAWHECSGWSCYASHKTPDRLAWHAMDG